MRSLATIIVAGVLLTTGAQALEVVQDMDSPPTNCSYRGKITLQGESKPIELWECYPVDTSQSVKDFLRQMFPSEVIKAAEEEGCRKIKGCDKKSRRKV